MIYYTIVGLVIGSFLNVCIYRIPRGESIAKEASHCTSCGQKIKRYDLIPVFSYLILQGHCRNCKAKISPRYAIVEFITASLFFLCAYKFKYTAETLLYTIFCCLLITMAYIDKDTMEIPDGIHIAIAATGLALMGLSDMHWYERVIGFFSVSVLLLIVAIITKGGMGGGDIKLMAASGLVLGWKLCILGFIIGSIAAAVYGIIVSKFKRENMKLKIPLGPFLAVGMLISLFVGDIIIRLYLGVL